MAVLQVFDPPMCCSTGICGPNINAVLPQFAADLEWLRSQGITVERFNLAQEPAAFARNPTVQRMLADGGQQCLPLILVDGRVVSRGVYPSRGEMAVFAGIAIQEPAITGRLASPIHLTTGSHRSSTPNRERGCCEGGGCCG